jgi:hypothetical protein
MSEEIIGGTFYAKGNCNSTAKGDPQCGKTFTASLGLMGGFKDIGFVLCLYYE